VRELGIEHVEPELAGFRLVALVPDELEPSFGVHEVPHEPSARDPVHVDAGSSDPHLSTVVATRIRLARRGRFGFVIEAPAKREEQTLSRLTPRREEEIDAARSCDLAFPVPTLDGLRLAA
jgi:hypothetical protein